MSFQPNKVAEFIKVFEDSKQLIRAFEGCEYLELIQDIHSSNVLMTYSYWISEDHLNNYRKSDLFSKTWAKTKVLFNDKPIAHSYHSIHKLT